VAAAAVTVAVIVVALGTFTWMAVAPMLSAFAVPACTKHDQRLAERLAANPVLTELRPGLTRAGSYHAAHASATATRNASPRQPLPPTRPSPGKR
jgi:hypothetical protein